MTLLNLLLLPFLFLRLLFDGDGAVGDAGGAGDPPAGDEKQAAPPADAKKTGAPRGSDESVLADLAKERDKRQAAEAEAKRLKGVEDELARIKEANQSESEKAINEAKKQAAAEERELWEGRTRRAEAKSALAAAGASDIPVAVAAFLAEHGDLKIDDNGDVENLTATVEAFKAAHPTLFTARVPSGSADQGHRPDDDKKPSTLADFYQEKYAGVGRS